MLGQGINHITKLPPSATDNELHCYTVQCTAVHYIPTQHLTGGEEGWHELSAVVVTGERDLR